MNSRHVESVADTAFMVAAWRAEESAQPNALFHNPFAARLAGERGLSIARTLKHPFGRWMMAIRTVVIDNFIQAAIAGGTDTVLNLGAGLDARPYRMALPETLRWIEVDRAEILALKEAQLASEKPRCKLERRALDLADPAQRKQLLADVHGKALVLTEGVVPYLSTEEAAGLAEDLRASATAFWIVDYMSPESLRYRRQRMAKTFEKAPFRFEPPDWFAFFDQHGWRVKEMRYLPEEAERLGRRLPVTPMMALRFLVTRPFMSAARREAFRKLTGYAVLERT